jgi:transcriptional regulator with XRE-family HTH domain
MRKQRGLTQAQVAQAMGVSQARVSRMEHGDVERMQVESIAAPARRRSSPRCRLALLPDDGPTGEFFSWDGTAMPW